MYILPHTRKWNTAVGSSDGSKMKRLKRQVLKKEFHKWQPTYEREHSSMVWLRADMTDKDKSIICVNLVCCLSKVRD